LLKHETDYFKNLNFPNVKCGLISQKSKEAYLGGRGEGKKKKRGRERERERGKAQPSPMSHENKRATNPNQ